MASGSQLQVKIEFGGGLELLFSNQRSHRVSIPAQIPDKAKATDVTFLLHYLRDNLLQDRPELFMENDTVYV